MGIQLLHEQHILIPDDGGGFGFILPYVPATNDVMIFKFSKTDSENILIHNWNELMSNPRATLDGLGNVIYTCYMRWTRDCITKYETQGNAIKFSHNYGSAEEQASGSMWCFRGVNTSGSPFTHSETGGANGDHITFSDVTSADLSDLVGCYFLAYAMITEPGQGPVSDVDFANTGDFPFVNVGPDHEAARFSAGAYGSYTGVPRATFRAELFITGSGQMMGTLDAIAPETAPVGPDVPTSFAWEYTLPDPTTAGFTVDQSAGPAPLTVQFADSSTDSPTTWAWDFGDGTTSTSQNPTHIFTLPGTYEVTLTATNAQGTDTYTYPIYVSDPAEVTIPHVDPVASFTTDGLQILPGDTVTFTDTSSGSPVSWLWTFGGNEGTSASQNPTHQFDLEGQYSVSLLVTNSSGDTSYTVQVVNVSNAGHANDTIPTATITASLYKVRTHTNVTFTSVVSTPDVFYQWDFGDGSTSSEASPVHDFALPGKLTVSLTVTNVYGQTTCSIVIVVIGRIAWGISREKTYQLDQDNDRVSIYSSAGSFIKHFGRRGSTPGKLIAPTTLHVVRPIMGG